MIDVENFIKIKQVNWIESMINSNPATWNILQPTAPYMGFNDSASNFSFCVDQ
jgi:hypothetical protein